MNAHVKNKILAPALVALVMLLANRAPAPLLPFTALHHFSPLFANSLGISTNYDGSGMVGGLLLGSNVLYGAAAFGGTNGMGTVFAMNASTGNFTNLHNFALTNSAGANSGGWRPDDSLTLVGDSLFGTGRSGGTNANGGVFTLGTNGIGFKDLHGFAASATVGGKQTNSDGTTPEYGPLLYSSNVLYGAATLGGTNGNGTLFAIGTNGTGFKTLYTFSAFGTNSLNRLTNRDGSNPDAGLILSGATLYGAAFNGGTNGWGTIFAIGTNGTGFKVLHHFSAPRTNAFGVNTNSEGVSPLARLVLSGDTLYGTATGGGANGNGTVFALNTNGTGFTTLHAFSSLTVDGLGHSTNGDGATPFCVSGLALSGNTLFGTTFQGGVNGLGAVFAVNTAGNVFTNLHSFSARALNASFISTNGDGANPFAGPVFSGSFLYGTTPQGGTNGNGTVYAMTAQELPVVANPPQLTIWHSGTNIFITWPTNLTGLTLQSATNLDSAVWITATPAPGIVSTNHSFTNSTSVPRKFYRLN